MVNIFPRLSVFENVQIAVLSRERKTFRIFSTVERMAEEEVHRILRSVGLFDRRDVESGLLSHGDKKESGLTILFCEHDISLVFEIAHRIMVMVRGATVVQGSCEEVRSNSEVQSAYLGESGGC
ncbi:MAG: amino acid/amide transporter ATP-binding protein 1, family [Deltaproteobacteria bacterium]|nr:amino acid/amide transporter ATP-binding protein 1, family [Deltaproteobacteria bacterium]